MQQGSLDYFLSLLISNLVSNPNLGFIQGSSHSTFGPSSCGARLSRSAGENKFFETRTSGDVGTLRQEIIVTVVCLLLKSCALYELPLVGCIGDLVVIQSTVAIGVGPQE